MIAFCNTPEQLQTVIARMPFLRSFKVRVVPEKNSGLSVALEPQPELMNHLGTYQAGVYLTLLEVAGGVFCSAFFDIGNNFLMTKEMSTQFLKASNERLSATAILEEAFVAEVKENLHKKRKTDVRFQVRLVDASGDLVAQSENQYYLRMGIPKIFSTPRPDGAARS